MARDLAMGGDGSVAVPLRHPESAREPFPRPVTGVRRDGGRSVRVRRPVRFARRADTGVGARAGVRVGVNHQRSAERSRHNVGIGTRLRSSFRDRAGQFVDSSGHRFAMA